MNRRVFIKRIAATGILLQIPWWVSCDSSSTTEIHNEILKPHQKEIVEYYLSRFFPDVPGSPSVKELNTYRHINTFLNDSNIDPDEQEYFINGTKWINETAMEIFGQNFHELKKNQQQKVFFKTLDTSWGTSWSSKLLTLTFESLLLDPLYHVNTNEKGWKWLHHTPGTPRPSNKNSYLKLLARKKEEIIITDLSQL